MKCNIYMDPNFIAKFKGDATNTLRRTMAHAQNLFFDPTFATKLTLEIANIYEITKTLGLLAPGTL